MADLDEKEDLPLEPLASEKGNPDSQKPSTYSGDVESQKDSPPQYDYYTGVSGMMCAIEKSKDGKRMTHYVTVVETISDYGTSLICALPMAGLALAMIIIGGIYLHDCPGERFIPVWLLVFGVFSLAHFIVSGVRTLVLCCCCNGEKEGGQNNASRGSGCCGCAVSVFMLAWFIAGNVWVFRFYPIFYSPLCQPVAVPVANGCCAALPYQFALGSIIAIYVICLLSLLLLCTCCCCCICCFASIAKLLSRSRPYKPID